MIRDSLCILIVCIAFKVFGQEIPKDSLVPTLNWHQSATAKQVSVRVGAGLQKSYYTEFGLAIHRCNYGDTGFFSNDFYTAIEWMSSQENNIYGLKVGYEVNAYALNVGLEIKYQTDFLENDIVITPKVGLGLFGDVNIFYGYNISTGNDPFKEVISTHQLSIILNLNNHFLQYL